MDTGEKPVLVPALAEFLVVCLAASAAGTSLASTIPGNGQSPGDRAGYDRVKLYYGPWGSDQWEWGWAPKANPLPGDSWRAWGQLPEAAMYVQCAADSRYQYVAGGLGQDVQLSALWRNDMVSRTWESLAPMPQGVYGGAAAIIGDTLYVHGGLSYPTNLPVNLLFKYCISRDTWTSEPGCCPANWTPCMVALDGKLYFMGGYVRASEVSNRVFCYAPGSHSAWVEKARMRHARCNAQAAAYGERVYVAGGYDDAGTLGAEVYDPAADTWIESSALFPNPPEGRWGGACAVAGTELFIYCGMSNNEVSHSVLVYDFDSKVWSSLRAPYSQWTYAVRGLVNARGEAIVFGGANGGLNPIASVSYCPTPTALLEEPATGPGSISLSVHPNPCPGRACIRYSLPEPGRVCLALYDVAGSLRATLIDGPSQAGVAVINAHLTNLPPAVYLLRLKTEHGSLAQKLVVRK